MLFRRNCYATKNFLEWNLPYPIVDQRKSTASQVTCHENMNWIMKEPWATPSQTRAEPKILLDGSSTSVHLGSGQQDHSTTSPYFLEELPLQDSRPKAIQSMTGLLAVNRTQINNLHRWYVNKSFFCKRQKKISMLFSCDRADRLLVQNDGLIHKGGV